MNAIEIVGAVVGITLIAAGAASGVIRFIDWLVDRR
jgi:hypothetical protein